MRSLLPIAILALGLGRAAAAAPGPTQTLATVAQEPATVLSPITVTGAIPRLSPPQLARAIDRFVISRGVTTRADRLARWRERVCIETLGLSPELDIAITRRIAEVGTTIGAPPTEAPGCRANIEVVFTTQPQAFIDRVEQRAWILVGYHYASQTRRVTRVVRPIQAWYVTGTRGDANVGAAVAGTVAEMSASAGEMVIDDPFTMQAGGVAGTRIPDGPRSLLANALILVDQTKVAGQSTQAIADYVAVLAYAQVRDPEACTPLPSILDLLARCSPPRAPEGLTPSDVSYLRALYTLDTGLEVQMVRGEIRTAMTRSLRGR